MMRISVRDMGRGESEDSPNGAAGSRIRVHAAAEKIIHAEICHQY